MLLHQKTFAICLVLAFFSSILVAFNNGQQDYLKYKLRNPYVGRLVHNIEIYNLGPSMIFAAELYVPLISNYTSRHFSYIESISPTPEEIFVDEYGKYCVRWKTQISKEETFKVSIIYNIFSFNVVFSIDSSLIESYNESSTVFQNYTKPEEFIESGAPDIVSTAQSIIGNETNPQEIALKVYDYVVNTLTYTTQVDEKGALWALKNKKGDCSEYSYLFAALCRAVGIPARVKVGFAFQSDSTVLTDGHMWAEYYLENYGWIPIDGSWGLFASLDNLHFSTRRCIPQFASYSNYFFNFTGTSYPQHKQTVTLQRTSPNILSDPLAQTLYNVISENGNVEMRLFLSKSLGSSLFFSAEVDEAIQTLKDVDLSLQNSMEKWGDLEEGSVQGLMNTAKLRSETANKLVENLILKSLIVDIAFLFIIITVVAVLLAKRKGKQLPYATYQTTIEP